jgi:phosphoglycolate phosphatase
MKTANDAGVHSVGVTWGFREREELEEYQAEFIATTAEELLKIIL